MYRIIFHFSLTLFLLSNIACQSSNEADVDSSLDPIVVVNDKVLYLSQLKELIPIGLTSEDSAKIAETYIDKWISDELIYEKARQNVDDAEINQMVEDYRRNLILNTYEARLLREMVANKVSDEELEKYYKENSSQFKLEENIIKGLFLKVPESSSQVANFQKWYKQGTEEAVSNIEKATLQNVVGYDYFYNKWVDFDSVLDNIPMTISDQSQYLKGNRNIEYKDDSFVYLLNIKEYKLKGDIAPFDYIKSQIEEIVLEKRRKDFLQQIKKDLYDKAIEKDEIKFYKK